MLYKRVCIISACSIAINPFPTADTDLSLCKDELTRTRHLLEAAQEDVQMTKMSLSEKNVEHLEAQDRLL